MNCSVRGEMEIKFKDYKQFESFDDPSRVLQDGSWNIGFDE